MIRKKMYLLFALLLMITTLAISGCKIGPDSAKDIATKIKEANSKIKSFTATVESTASFGNESQKMVMKQWVKSPNLMRMETEVPGMGQMLFVSDGKKAWSYEERSNTVTVFDFKGEEVPETLENNEDFAKAITEFIAQNNIEVMGAQKIAGRDCYEIKLNPKEGSAAIFGKMKMWVDKETFMPLKIDIYEDEKLIASTVYKDLKYNVDIPQDTFRFKIPAGAKVINASDLMPKDTTLEDAKKSADFTLYAPADLPKGTKLGNVQKINAGGRTIITIGYLIGGEENLQITQMKKDPNEPPMPNAKEIKINGNDGKMVSMNGFTVVQWEQGGTTIVVEGTLDKETVLKIAKSMK
ncbi:MAG TPA: outer membrane lipoprotein-sorting protein [Anaerolineae bacterium]|jgi:chaperone LolA|nr:outer membrane lipoprotein-sorting protein [Anaerolineae bacterium]